MINKNKPRHKESNVIVSYLFWVSRDEAISKTFYTYPLCPYAVMHKGYVKISLMHPSITVSVQFLVSSMALIS